MVTAKDTQTLAKWTSNVNLTKLTSKSTFLETCFWTEKIEGGFRRIGVTNPETITPGDLKDISFLFLHESLHRHLVQEQVLGTVRWRALLNHLERKEFQFTYESLLTELDCIK